VKRILASLFVTSVAICSASAANAQITVGQGTSTHTGTVIPTCTLVAVGANLTSSETVPTSISSANGLGKFTTKCNSSHALRIELITGSNPLLPTGATYTEEFKLISNDDGYTGIASDFGSGQVNRGPLPATSTNGYVVAVEARGIITTGFYLPAGSYTIRVRATATPG
jgi:hypothetical protein